MITGTLIALGAIAAAVILVAALLCVISASINTDMDWDA